MPFHQSSFISRHALEHPDEQLPTKKPDLLLERVLKFNPNHDPQSGRFSSGGGGRQGGTAGAPTTGAMGQPLGRGAKAKATRERRAAEHAARQQRTNSYQAEMQRQIKEMHGKGVYDPSGSLGGKSTTQRGLDFRPGRDTAGPPKTMEFRPDRDKGQGERQNLQYKKMLQPAAKPDYKPDPVGTQYSSDETLTPTGKKGVVPSNEPFGTIHHSDGQTLIPYKKGYIDKDTGQIYHSDAAERKVQATADRASDAAAGAAYVARYGRRRGESRRAQVKRILAG